MQNGCAICHFHLGYVEGRFIREIYPGVFYRTSLYRSNAYDYCDREDKIREFHVGWHHE